MMVRRQDDLPAWQDDFDYFCVFELFVCVFISFMVLLVLFWSKILFYHIIHISFLGPARLGPEGQERLTRPCRSRGNPHHPARRTKSSCQAGWFILVAATVDREDLYGSRHMCGHLIQEAWGEVCSAKECLESSSKYMTQLCLLLCGPSVWDSVMYACSS